MPSPPHGVYLSSSLIGSMKEEVAALLFDELAWQGANEAACELMLAREVAKGPGAMFRKALGLRSDRAFSNPLLADVCVLAMAKACASSPGLAESFLSILCSSRFARPNDLNLCAQALGDEPIAALFEQWASGGAFLKGATSSTWLAAFDLIPGLFERCLRAQFDAPHAREHWIHTLVSDGSPDLLNRAQAELGALGSCLRSLVFETPKFEEWLMPPGLDALDSALIAGNQATARWIALNFEQAHLVSRKERLVDIFARHDLSGSLDPKACALAEALALELCSKTPPRASKTAPRRGL
jgi:hypothetical protein